MPQSSPQYYIGLMSGTSMDGIDAALVAIDQHQCQLVDALDYQLPSPLRKQIASLCQPSDNEIDRLGAVDRQLGEHFASAAKLIIERHPHKNITAIGSHGQTIRHRPEFEAPFTLQIGDANVIAERTGLSTVADFRRRDMAAGGQGAPLAPAFHQCAFGSKTHNRVIVNIGGMANITPLINGIAQQGFDSGPGNVLMDSWIQQNQDQDYDCDGEWAASGSIDQPLLSSLLNHPFLAAPAPKSTGREDFNHQWLQTKLSGKETAVDVQATLLEFTARSICQAINDLNETTNEVYICGGGAYNQALMTRLQTLLKDRSVNSTQALGIAPEWVEAAAFAWLAHQTLNQLSGNIPAATGASRPCILGAIYPA